MSFFKLGDTFGNNGAMNIYLSVKLGDIIVVGKLFLANGNSFFLIIEAVWECNNLEVNPEGFM